MSLQITEEDQVEVVIMVEVPALMGQAQLVVVEEVHHILDTHKFPQVQPKKVVIQVVEQANTLVKLDMLKVVELDLLFIHQQHPL